ncbi:hypothetical protein AB0A63_18150 [Lentzea sp. NPDC042327]|uniref:hypothetical protein n=1 Tax=Lentzea sp. NPDC042327 TaxID=3154801 RepID=UPI0033C376BC
MADDVITQSGDLGTLVAQAPAGDENAMVWPGGEPVVQSRTEDDWRERHLRKAYEMEQLEQLARTVRAAEATRSRPRVAVFR